MAPQPRDIIIGDVHGCVHELDRLIEEVRLEPGVDRVWFVGDLINKGPDSVGVMQRFHALGAKAVMGNHEWRLILQHDETQPRTGMYQRFQEQFGDDLDELVEEVRHWPLYIDRPEFLLVHGGIAPDIPLEQQSIDWLLNIRTWDGVGKDLANTANPPWFDLARHSKLVVFGHWAQLRGVMREDVIGLDTGCVYGGTLSALILPERRVVQVPAEKSYVPV